MRRRLGFTMIELLMVIIIVGILSALGLLKYIDLRATARTASLTGDVRSVTVAALNYFADHESWPAETGPGVVPPGLGPYLPGGLSVSFARPEYTLDYDNFDAGSGPVIAISVESSDAKLMAKFVSSFSSHSPFFMNGGKLSYLISGPGGVF